MPTVDVYRQLTVAGVFNSGQPIVLDSGCGTGRSTMHFAQMFPQHLVLGVDRSSVRLSKSGVDKRFLSRGNYVLVRAELATFWRLLLADGHLPERHFLLYPNPYPKAAHLKRRWHGHPVFPQLLNLGGEIEMRCNWEIYAQEFAQAVNLACAAQLQVDSFEAESGVSAFEQKYLERGQRLFTVKVPANIAAACSRAALSET